ncbi:hypothetical protein ACQUXI_004295 [Cronobacter turicensis]|nr:hypothetical protein [Cronobacter sakazakii]
MKFAGLLLLVLGLLICVVIYIITRPSPKMPGVVKPKRFRLPHEYHNKGFTEREQSEGTQDIPMPSQSPDDKYADFIDDPFFTHSESVSEKSSPGDNF